MLRGTREIKEKMVPKALKGTDGAQGPKGRRWCPRPYKGDVGPQGDKGATGAQGPKGDRVDRVYGHVWLNEYIHLDLQKKENIIAEVKLSNYFGGSVVVEWQEYIKIILDKYNLIEEDQFEEHKIVIEGPASLIMLEYRFVIYIRNDVTIRLGGTEMDGYGGRSYIIKPLYISSYVSGYDRYNPLIIFTPLKPYSSDTPIDLNVVLKSTGVSSLVTSVTYSDIYLNAAVVG